MSHLLRVKHVNVKFQTLHYIRHALMKIVDIVNRNAVNLQNCESEPIHIPGSIQSHGALIAINKGNQIITHCSENVLDLLGLDPSKILGKTLDTVFHNGLCGSIHNHLNSSADLSHSVIKCTINNIVFDCTLSLWGNYTIITFEPEKAKDPGVEELYDQTKNFVVQLESSVNLKQLCENVAGEIRRLTGYDRVMIYKFDKNYNGEVYAECCREDLETFLGLHYPHTDIPTQARELYKTNLLRIIPDIGYTPIPILTIDDGTDKQLDLSNTGLRSVSPMHIQYLQNMGVGATLTISLMHKGDLWGLVACHHYSPKYLSHFMRITARLQGHFLTSQIAVRQEAEEYDQSKQLQQHLEQLLAQQFELDRSKLPMLIKKPEVLAITHSMGVAVVLDNEVYIQGETPEKNDIQQLANWLFTYTAGKEFATHKLADIYKDAEKISKTSAGLLYQPITGDDRNCIIWFRPETITQVNWAGNPEKAIIKDENGLFPRKSFALWKEELKLQSKEWTQPEITAAAQFAHDLQKNISMMLLAEEEQKYRLLSIKLQEANSELENVNWISTHDLKEPLRKIQMFASRMLEDEDAGLPEKVLDGITRMRDSANRMQTLLADILAYSRILKDKTGFETIDLNVLMGEVIETLKEEIKEHNGKVEYENLPVIKGVPFLLNQLFVNLIRNSLKFGKDGEQPIVKIIFHKGFHVPPELEAGKFYRIDVQDNGIGFDAEFSESIFKVFVRLHSREKYAGTGVGLALCKKIMQSHDGFISAEGSSGEGACFRLYFPAN